MNVSVVGNYFEILLTVTGFIVAISAYVVVANSALDFRKLMFPLVLV